MNAKAIKILSAAGFFLLLSACGSSDTDPSPATLNLGPSEDSLVNTKLAVLDVAGSTERISTDSAGVQADQNSINSALSADGQIVVFDSTSTNLVANDNNVAWDIFVKNRRNGLTRRVSVATDGSQANGDSTS
ncbi:MAG: hypothetical protein ACC707_10105, partial [Thiohalomonadales bacterium]